MAGHDVARAWAILGALAILVLWLMQRAFARWSVRLRLRGRMRRARRAELDAPRWLLDHGYTVTAAQVSRAYALLVDGDELCVQVRADYLVEREGLHYVAEVKTGMSAPSLRTQATRRQLLEYRMAFAVDGVLLVDAEAERVHVVRFPLDLERTPRVTQDAWLLAAALLLALAVIVWLH